MPKHAARPIAVVLALTTLAFLTPLPASGFSIFTPTRENATGVPYLHTNPNTGAYANPADRSGTVKRPVLSEAKLDADAATTAEMKRYLRLFRYAYIGVGVQGSDIRQNGVSSSATNYGGSMGIDSDGLVNPLTLELSGKFYGSGSDTTFGETFLMVYGEFPISAAGGCRGALRTGRPTWTRRTSPARPTNRRRARIGASLRGFASSSRS